MNNLHKWLQAIINQVDTRFPGDRLLEEMALVALNLLQKDHPEEAYRIAKLMWDIMEYNRNKQIIKQ